MLVVVVVVVVVVDSVGLVGEVVTEEVAVSYTAVPVEDSTIFVASAFLPSARVDAKGSKTATPAGTSVVVVPGVVALDVEVVVVVVVELVSFLDSAWLSGLGAVSLCSACPLDSSAFRSSAPAASFTLCAVSVLGAAVAAGLALAADFAAGLAPGFAAPFAAGFPGGFAADLDAGRAAGFFTIPDSPDANPSATSLGGSLVFLRCGSTGTEGGAGALLSGVFTTCLSLMLVSSSAVFCLLSSALCA